MCVKGESVFVKKPNLHTNHTSEHLGVIERGLFSKPCYKLPEHSVARIQINNLD